MPQILKDTTIKVKQKPIVLTKWRERIETAKNSEDGFTREDKLDSNAWMKCACGERMKLDEEVNELGYKAHLGNSISARGKARTELRKHGQGNLLGGSPSYTDSDMVLTDRANDLGGCFPAYVKNNNFSGALDTVKKVERLRHLVKEKFRETKPQQKTPKSKIQSAKTILENSKK